MRHIVVVLVSRHRAVWQRRVGCFRLLSGGSSPGGEGRVKGSDRYLHGVGGGHIFSSCILIMHLFLTVASNLTIYFFQQIILSNFWLSPHRVLLLKSHSVGTVVDLFPARVQS